MQRRSRDSAAPRLVLALVLGAAPVLAQSETPDGAPPAAPVESQIPAAPAGAPAEPAPPPDSACFPPCREGYVCQKAECVSLCNPPCPEGQVCVDGARCDIALPAPRVSEPPPPRRIPFPERSYSIVAFHYGFPSAIELDGADGPRDSVLGVNLRSDVPVARYVLVGPMFEFGAYEPGYYFDLDFYLRARLPLDGKSVQWQLWAGVPVGLTFSFLREGFAPELEGFSLGWNIGVLAGGAVHFSRQFGLATELGWQQHRMTHDRAGGGSVGIALRSWVWNVGFIFRG